MLDPFAGGGSQLLILECKTYDVNGRFQRYRVVGI